MLLKRIFDFVVALAVLLLFGWLILLFWLIAAIDTKSTGLFLQRRIGQHGKPFTIVKLRSMSGRQGGGVISAYGNWMRRYKIDELPQFLHVLLGQMSLVGPRPDVPGYYDRLEGGDREILRLKPGLTSEAALKYANEEAILSKHRDPLRYNDEVIFPDKVRMNLDYLYNRSFLADVRLLLRTLLKFTVESRNT